MSLKHIIGEAFLRIIITPLALVANGAVGVVISNVAGQKVIDIEHPNREIRAANLISGVYVISLFTEDGIAKTERIINR